jgi:uncharacterized protein (TIGR03067 family)
VCPFALRLAAFAAVVALSASASAAPVPKALRGKSEPNALVGEWREMTVDAGGSSTGTPTGYVWRFEPDGKASVVWPDGTIVAAEYRLDPTGSPKGFDWVLPKHSARFVGVYEVSGDVLRTATASAGRPPASELRPAPQVEYRVYERVKVSR